MAEGILAEEIKDLSALELAAQKHGYPLQVLPEFGLEDFRARTVQSAGELDEAFTAAATKSPTATVWVRRP